MSGKPPLNGCDYLMLGFDHELRRLGFAGNSCQIILELKERISPETLQKRLSEFRTRWPILQARPGGIFLPHWIVPADSVSKVTVRTHPDQPELRRRLCNEPLRTRQGELVRFDLIERDQGAMSVVFTWAHALMDAPSAEHLLAFIGRDDLTVPATINGEGPAKRPLGLIERFKLGWKTLYRVDQMSKAAPKSLSTRRPQAATELDYRVIRFSVEETRTVRANGEKVCGVLGAAQFHAAAAMVELQRLHEQLHSPSPSYVLPVPVGLRPKGTFEPLFSNQVTMLMTQFLPEDLVSVPTAAGVLKRQMQEAIRSDLLESGRVLSELFRFLPLRIYMTVLKQGFRGEICSLFYGDTAGVDPNLTRFLGAPIEDFVHVAAITPSPGIGVIFYYFQQQLRVTVLHLLTVISETEAADFAAKLRQRLLNP
jgi:hypothetical protein